MFKLNEKELELVEEILVDELGYDEEQALRFIIDLTKRRGTVALYNDELIVLKRINDVLLVEIQIMSINEIVRCKTTTFLITDDGKRKKLNKEEKINLLKVELENLINE